MARASQRAQKSSSRSPSRSRSLKKETLTASNETSSMSVAKSKSVTNYVLDPGTQKRLANWKYHSGGYTPIDVQMNKFWEWAVTLLPWGMAPNLVTLTGLIIVSSTAFLMVCYDPNFATTAPNWVYGVGLLGHFLYQTFDAIDGKQARRTKTSSPLGQLFDHGCDAFITNVVGIFNASCMQYGSSSWTILNTVLNFNVFFLAQWEEYHTGQLNTNNGFIGLTEGQLLQFFMMLTVTLFGPESWHFTVSSLLPPALADVPVLGTVLSLEIRYAALIPMAGVTMMLAIQSFIRVMFTVKQKNIGKADHGAKEFGSMTSLCQLGPQYIMYLLGYWLTTTQYFQKSPLILFLLWGGSCSFYTTKVIVAQMSKSPIDWRSALVNIVLPMLLATSFLAKFWFLSYSVSDEAAVFSWALILLPQYIFFAGGVCSDLSSYLKISVFTI